MFMKRHIFVAKVVIVLEQVLAYGLWTVGKSLNHVMLQELMIIKLPTSTQVLQSWGLI